jgi:hypothetical protein
MLFSPEMRRIARAATSVSLALTALLVACGSEDDDDAPGRGSGDEFSCARVEGDSCVEYGGTQQSLETLRDACDRQGGTPGTGCSRRGAQGACTLTAGQAYVRTIYYGMDTGALEGAERTCVEGQGVWSATP